MKTNDSNLMVWVGEKDVWVKVSGRATFNCTVDFKHLVTSLSKNGYLTFSLDLTNCLLMDSTFLGVLSGLGLKLCAREGSRATIRLVNPNERISDLLENLGVTHLFQVVRGVAQNDPEQREYVPQPSSQPSPEDLLRTSRDAHDELMQINPANIDKFKDVRRFLDEDLKKIQEKNKPSGSEGPGVAAGG